MNLVDLYKNKKYGFPIVSFIFAITCLIVSIPTYFDNSLVYLFAIHSKPTFFWQYFSGFFEHTIYNICTGNLAPWFIFVHLGFNMAILLIFGIIIEKNIGSKQMFYISFISAIINIISFMFITNIILKTGNVCSAGASSIVYSYAPIAIYLILKTLKANKNYNQILTYIYILVLFVMYGVITFLSSFLGSTIWHLIATIVGILYLTIFKKEINKNFTTSNVQVISKKKNFITATCLSLMPLLMIILIVLYKFKFIKM